MTALLPAFGRASALPEEKNDQPKKPEAVPSGAHSWPTEKTTQKPYIPNNLEKHRKSPGSPKISGVLYGTLHQN